MKFGGTSVEDSEAFSNVAHIVKSAAPERIVVVVSAIGRFTDALLASVEKANDGDARAATGSIEQDLERHRAIANQLLGDEGKAQVEVAVADARDQIRELHKIVAAHPSTHAPLRDEIVAFGELLSSQLLGAVLRENGLAARYVDARRLIKTEESYGGAAPLAETTTATQATLRPLIEAGEIPVLGGFHRLDHAGRHHHARPGGSDFSGGVHRRGGARQERSRSGPT